jgi:hypothetical protein
MFCLPNLAQNLLCIWSISNEGVSHKMSHIFTD